MREGDSKPIESPSRGQPKLPRPISSTADGELAQHSVPGNPAWEVSGLVEQATPGPLERLGLGSIGEYQLVDELARGGMGVVYRARHPSLNRNVAIKVLHAGERAGPHQLARFQTEARAAARLRHPAIVAIHDVGSQDRCPYIVMDLIEGASLQAEIDSASAAGGSLSERRVAELTQALAEALQAAHAEGILHRDVKPPNVLISAETNRPLLTDFGLAKEVDSRQGLTKTGQFMGTPGYCAPEQMRGETDRVDGRADVYGLGATMYAMLTGRAPIVGDTAVQTIVKMMEGVVQPPSNRRPDLSRDLETICLKCLEREPDQRYASAAALAEDLTRFLDDEPISARRPSPIERLLRWSRRHKTLVGVLAAGGLALLAVAVGGSAWFRHRAAQAQRQQEADEAQAAAERRQRATQEAADEIRALLRRAGDRPLDPAELTETVAKVTARHAPEAAKLLETELDRVVQEVLLPAEREVAKAAEQPSPGEARAGAKPIAALDEALRVKATKPPGQALPARLQGALTAAWRRIRQRAIRRKGAERDVPTRGYARRLIASRQARALAPHGAQRLQVICRALAELELPAVAIPALGRYLDAEADEERATHAAKALCHLGGHRAQAIVFQALERFASDSFQRALDQPLARLAVTSIDESDSEQLAGRARIRVAQRDRAGALTDLDRALRLAPKQASLWHARGDVHARLLHPKLADRDYSEALKLEPTSATLLSKRANMRRQLSRDREAAADIERALEIDPYFVKAWVSKALLLMSKNRHQDAVAVLKRAIRIDPLHAETWYQRGRALKALRNYPAALSDYTRAIRLDPYFAKAWRNRGAIRRRLKDLEGARRDLDRGVELDPGNPWGRIYRGNLRVVTGDLEGALSDYRRAIAEQATLGRAWTDQASALLRLGRLEQAQRSAQQAVALGPKDPGAWIVRGDVHRAQRKHALAEAAYTKALEFDPTHTMAIGNRAMTRTALGRLDAALRDANDAVKREPESASALNNRALVHKARGDLQRAMADLNGALALDASFAGGYVNRADLYLRLKQPARALEDLTRATKLDPRLASAWVHRAALLRAQGRNAEAKRDADTAVRLAPSEALAWGVRGLARAALGESKQAIVDLEQFLKLAPRGHAERALIERRLTTLREEHAE